MENMFLWQSLTIIIPILIASSYDTYVKYTSLLYQNLCHYRDTGINKVKEVKTFYLLKMQV